MDARAGPDLHVMLNMNRETVDAAVPTLPSHSWHVALDTGNEPPRDVAAPDVQRVHMSARYAVRGRSVVVLEARRAR